jgi:hypothetical protein
VKIIGIFYTHNQIKPELLKASLDSINRAVSHSNSLNNCYVDVFTCPWEPIPDNPFFSSPDRGFPFKHNGSLNILMQILHILYKVEGGEKEPDVVAFLEHDCLYHHEYFENIAQIMKAGGRQYMGFSNRNFMGMNGTGYLNVTQRDEPMSQLGLRYQYAMAVMEAKQRQCIKRPDQMVMVEPDEKNLLVHIPYHPSNPQVIHVNMNKTGRSHHFTNHYDCYEQDSKGKVEDVYWGDFKRFNIF